MCESVYKRGDSGKRYPYHGMPPLFGESIHRMTTQCLIAIDPAIALHLTTGKSLWNVKVLNISLLIKLYHRPLAIHGATLLVLLITLN